MKPARAATRRYLPGSPFNTPPVIRPVKEFATGDQVTHDRYGLGRVLSADDLRSVHQADQALTARL
jgi:hypothetical protein